MEQFIKISEQDIINVAHIVAFHYRNVRNEPPVLEIYTIGNEYRVDEPAAENLWTRLSMESFQPMPPKSDNTVYAPWAECTCKNDKVEQDCPRHGIPF